MSWKPNARAACAAVLLAALASPTLAGTGDRYEIRLLAGSLCPDPGVKTEARRDLEARAAKLRARGEETLHVLVQLHQVPDLSSKLELSAAGLDLGTYASGNAWIAALSADRLGAVVERPEVRWIAAWDEGHKLHPRLAAGDLAPWSRDPERPGWVMLALQLHHDVALEAGERLAEAVGGTAMTPVDGLHGLTVWLPEERLLDLTRREEVLWIEEGLPSLGPANDGVLSETRAGAVKAAPFGLDGSGVRLLVFDSGAVRSTHETFDPGSGSRVTVIDGAAVNTHATSVAGTAAGDGSGSTGGRGEGVATGADVLSAGYQQSAGTMPFWDNAGDLEADLALARNTHDADLANHSLASNVAANGDPCSREGDYGVASSLLDGIVRGDNAAVGSALISIWSAGNERTGQSGLRRGRCGANYATTAPPACAKNPIQVGAANSDGSAMTAFSSWGPCDDGRLKPLVVAPGCETSLVSPTPEDGILSAFAGSDSAYGVGCGTSYAAAATSGVVALLIEDWRALGFGGATARPLPALVKTLLMHTARDRGQDGPDFIYGYGAIDALGLIGQLRCATTPPAALPAGCGSLADLPRSWGTGAVADGATDAFTVTVPAGTAELRVSLAWDDPAAAAFAAAALVNDLDLEVVAPSAAVSLPFVLDPAVPHLDAAAGVNAVDNQEQVVVRNPAAGTWTVRVSGTGVPSGPQSYGLAWSVTPELHNSTACTTTSFGWETGAEGWTLDGAAVEAAPAAGHGATSLRLGGAPNSVHQAFLDVAVPAGTVEAELTYYAFLSTAEGGNLGHGYDLLLAEVRDTADTPLEVFDLRTDGWAEGEWMRQRNVDLAPYAGTTVRLAFRAANDPLRLTSFYVDDARVVACGVGSGGADAFVANYDEADQFCANDGSGGFTCSDIPGTLPALQTRGVAAGDLDGDGDVDAVFANGNPAAQINRLCLSDGLVPPTFTCAAVSADLDRTHDVEVGDLDGDGDLDMVFANILNGERNRVCLNDGASPPGFTCSDVETVGAESSGVALGDVDGVNGLDLVFARTGSMTVARADRVCLNDGGSPPSFTCSAVEAANLRPGRDVALGDVDGDGNLDAVFANFQRTNRVCFGDGAGGFEDLNAVAGQCSNVSADTFSSREPELADLDGDGDLDVVFANRNNSEPNRRCLSNGLPRPAFAFTCGDVSPALRDAIGMALGDVDGDGDPDPLFANGVTTPLQPNEVCFNDGTPSFTCATMNPEPARDSFDVALTGTAAAAPSNTPPEVAITSPPSGSSFTSGDTVTFTGTAADFEDGDLSAGLVWSSSLDGPLLPGGASFMTSALSVGVHVITATVTDSDGESESASITVTVTCPTATFSSIAAEDGWLLQVRPGAEGPDFVGEFADAGDAGGLALRAGDEFDYLALGEERQYKLLTSFDTSTLPDDATVTAATLRLRRGGLIGTSPFTTHGALRADVRTGAFGGSTALVPGDWQAAATANAVATLTPAAADGDFSDGTFNAAGRAAVNVTGRTQLRAAFAVRNDGDGADDVLGFYSGESVAGDRPQLVVSYLAATCGLGPSPPLCAPGALCLDGGRFEVAARWRDFAGNEGTGRAVPLSADTGYFWFFDDANVELVVKVLDGRALNGHFWVFYGALSNVEFTLDVTDTETGAVKSYANPAGRFASVGDTEALPGSGAEAFVPPPRRLPPGPAAAGEKTCAGGPESLCLQQSRFRLEVEWRDFAGNRGAGRAVALSADTGTFWFFDDANVELVVKVLDGRALNDRFWVFYGALSNVEYTLTVTDTATGAQKSYFNPAGRFASAGDTEAF